MNDKIRALQSPSTLAIMDRDPADDFIHWARPLVHPKQDTSDLDKLTNKINPDVGQVVVYEHMRRKYDDIKAFASSNESSITPEKKELAIQAFTCTPPAPLTTRQLIELNNITRYIPVIDLNKTKERKEGWPIWIKYLIWLSVYYAIIFCLIRRYT